MVTLIIIGSVLFAQPPEATQDRHMRHWVLGVAHAVAQIALAIGGTWVWLRLPFHGWAWRFEFDVASECPRWTALVERMKQRPAVKRAMEGRSARKVIVVPQRIVNVVA